ncbi:hypothetical protein CEXT_365571 [Caerostris extrusa]|uniref:Uncharacterized protein n=1 Tax=Caerostris extrusa TaxID=172846 RepID=A0AAV4UYC1_CAEEX|nr:hypothetical protein CEXT_365571 [Caerostris extrusa]
MWEEAEIVLIRCLSSFEWDPICQGFARDIGSRRISRRGNYSTKRREMSRKIQSLQNSNKATQIALSPNERRIFHTKLPPFCRRNVSTTESSRQESLTMAKGIRFPFSRKLSNRFYRYCVFTLQQQSQHTDELESWAEIYDQNLPSPKSGSSQERQHKCRALTPISRHALNKIFVANATFSQIWLTPAIL